MINVIGLGYIGLPTALVFASHGNEVVGTDYNHDLVATLNSGKTTFKEDGLDALFQEALQKGISFSTDYQKSDVYIISVPTPYDKNTKLIDAGYVVKAVSAALDVAPKGAILVIESTVSPGTIDRFVRPIIAEKGFVLGEDVNLVHAPERIIPGNMLNELYQNNRTIGADDPAIGEKVKALYSTFCKGDIVVTDIRTAEMTKVVENTFRDINIAYANELAKICRQEGMDVYEIIRIANMHPRVNILSPGPGVGGHCISVDPWFLVGDYPMTANLIRCAREINDSMPDFVLYRASEIMEELAISSTEKVGIYGITYKEDVDDIRESPTLQLLDSMKRHLALKPCRVYDPWVKDDMVPNQVHSISEFLDGIELVIVMVGHSELKDDLSVLDGVAVLDTRNVCGNADNIYKL